MNEDDLYRELKRLHAINEAFHLTDDTESQLRHVFGNLKQAMQVRLLTDASDRVRLDIDSNMSNDELTLRVDPPVRGIKDAKHMPLEAARYLGVWRD